MRIRALALLSIVPLVAAGAPLAHADDSFYSQEVLASDCAADALVISGFAQLDDVRGPNMALLWPGVGLYFLGAPALHLAHGDGKVALESLGLRVGALLPLALSLAGSGEGHDGAVGVFFCGLLSLVAIVTVEIVDAGYLTPDSDDASTPTMMPLLGGRF